MHLGVFQAWNGEFGDSFLVLFFLGETNGRLGGDAAGFSWGEVSRGGGGAAMGRWQFGGLGAICGLRVGTIKLPSMPEPYQLHFIALKLKAQTVYPNSNTVEVTA